MGVSLPDSTTILLVIAVLSTWWASPPPSDPCASASSCPFGSLRSGLGQVGKVFQSPARVGALFGGSLGVPSAMCCVSSPPPDPFGGGLTLAQTGAAYLGAVAIAMFAPTPGGLGALE